MGEQGELDRKLSGWSNLMYLPAMGSTADAVLRVGVALLRLPQHSQNLRAISPAEVLHVHLRCHRWVSFPGRDGGEDLSAGILQRR